MLNFKLIASFLIITLFISCKQDKKNAISNNKIHAYQLKDIQLSSGTLQRIDSFPSKYIRSRTVDIWLPDNYSEAKKYAVLYMHDGQMLFDSTTTWNKQEWKVDEIASRLMQEGITRNFIVVALSNTGIHRQSEYFPEKPFQKLVNKDSIFKSAQLFNQGNFFNGPIQSDNYLKFIVNEVKPFIDSQFSVYTNRENTFIMGSSMGGLISMYAICEYPDVFGGAACLSTNFSGIVPEENDDISHVFFDYLQENIPSPKTHKFYFDYGTTSTIEEYYPRYAPEVNAVFAKKGYDTKNFKNLKFEGAEHTENSWNKRLDIPLVYLLKK
ncbi:esterase [Yeosuana aromativorans]|uniref:Esterase n=1 Tax=Yeosuana aromativorans TaxID=288019 RepID=A0A8J3BHD2_9FLAO|nr:alpha/beta hydrolase-fold protein [Yeosuana aromativorans]GGK21419.1 esterase [Yeosuana aromativorans]